ncbi:hypothetical protein [Pseudomonas veronii]
MARLKRSERPTMTVLGDSNSHGVGAVDIYRNSYVNTLKRLMNSDLGSENYGFTPLMSTGTGGYFSQEIHQVSFLATGGRKNTWQPLEASSCGHVPQGLSFVSMEPGNIIATTVPTFQRRVVIWYVAQPEGGTFLVKVNGSSVTTVNTSSRVIDALSSITLDINDGHYDHEALPYPTLSPGLCRIECITTSNRIVELCGFSYISSEKKLTVNNFSNSGRRLLWVEDSAIESMLKASDVFLLSLGYNDEFDNSNDPDYFEAFSSRIDSIVRFSKLYNVSVFVADFVWDGGAESKTRLALQRLARETDGVYIPLPDILSPDGKIPSWRYRMNTLKLFFEPAHLNKDGHEYAADVIGRHLGLSATSKKHALSYCDWWYPIRLLGTGIGNIGTNSDSVSAVRNIGNGSAALRLGITGIISSIKRDIASAWPIRAGIKQKGISTHQLTPHYDGASRGTFLIADGGKITAAPNEANDMAQHSCYVIFQTID